MPQLKLDHTGNEPWHVTLDKIDQMFVERFAGGPGKQKLDLTSNEPMHRTLDKIKQMLIALGATPTFDTSGATSLSRTLGSIDRGFAVIYAGSTTPVPTNRIRNSTDTGYVLSLTGGYSTFGAPTYA